MCSRYVIDANADIAEPVFAHARNWPAHVHVDHNIAPAQMVPIVRWEGGEAVALTARWGFIPAGAGTDSAQPGQINARIESMRSSPCFRGAWRKSQRCLIPASGFYEWKVTGDGTQPYYITCADQPLFAFAGLWEASTSASGELVSCAIITLPASPMMADIHNNRRREPAILRREEQDAWLHGDADAALACLQPYRDELRAAWPVSAQVNSPQNNGDALVRPVAVSG